MKPFLAAGDVLINPALLAFAAVETDSDGLRLWLRFSGPGPEAGTELELDGLEARSMLSWLRRNAEFLDSRRSGVRLDKAADSRSLGVGRTASAGCCRDVDLIAASH